MTTRSSTPRLRRAGTRYGRVDRRIAPTPPKDAMTSAHKLINPSTLAPPLGFSHAAVAAEGRTVYLGGQTAHGPTGILQGSDIVEQFLSLIHISEPTRLRRN